MRSVSTARGRKGLAAKIARKARGKSWHDNKSNIAAFFAPSIAFALYSTAAAAAGTNVAPDGRTQTQLTTVGSVTDVTTSTIHNGNAFNSFSQFQVGQGDTVNLHVPDSAQRLLNVVHDGPVNVDGVVNGYKNGKIGGDVYFADPYGFVVGKTGSVNVGSLTVRTPTKDATEKLIDQNGNIDDATASGVIDGTLPVSPDGSVVIRGKIRTVNGMHISAQNVDTTAASADATAFNASVNTRGLKQGGDIRATNGDIEITAAGDASIGGTIASDGASGQSGGHIAITAGNDIALDKTTNISAKGVGTASNGGNIKVYAGHNLNVASGAKADVSGGTTGNGGTIELSAVGTASFSSATLNAGATSGIAGSIIIDPTDVVIGPTTSVDVGASSQPSIDTNGGSVTITASDSIVLEANAFINTRKTGASAVKSANNSTDISMGNSGAVTLTSRHITIDGTINASAINDSTHNYSAGDVTLTASDSFSQNEGKVEVGTSIDIYGTILGGKIDVESNSQAYSEMNTLDQVASSLVSSLFGAGIGYVDAQATAAINIYSGANIRGAGDVTFNSWTVATASDPVLIGPASSIVGTVGFVPSVMVGNVTAKATAAVASGATVTSGGTLTVRAHNDATLDVSQLTVTGNVPIDVSVAYTTADVEANATVAEGATIAAQNAHVTARNDNSFSTSVSVVALGTASAGISVAIADGYTTEANAHFGASLSAMLDDPSTASVDESLTPANSLTVEAESMTTKDAVSSSTTVGAGLIVRFFTKPVADALSAVKGKFASVFDKINMIKFGASIALTLDETHTANATIGGDAAHAPTIRANQVAVVADTLDQGARSSAASATNSPDVPDATAANPTAAISVSAAVAYADRTINTNATIGSGAVIDAQRVGLYSNTDLPVTITWLTGDDFETVMSHINGTLGAANDVLTTYTNATGDAGEYGVNGSVNLFNVTANTKSFIGDGAAVNVTGAVAGSWSPTLDTAEDNSHGIDPRTHPLPAADPVFDQSVSVLASRDIETLNFGGNLTIFLNGAGGTNEDAASVGATYSSVNYDGDTIAGIGDKATVTSDKGAEVKANATDKAINVSPTAGRGGGVAISGMVALYDLDTRVHASIASTAKVSATSLDLTANQVENIGTVAGALMVGNENSVGGMETTNTILTHVAAYIGDNSQDDTSNSASLIPSFTAPTAGVTVTGGTVNLAATETGLVQSLAVSLEVGDDAALGASISVNNINDDVTTSIDNATVTAQNVYLNSNANDTIHTIAMGASASGDIAFAGSAATANISPSIYATISGGSVVTADDNVGVIAINNDEIETIAGAGAIGIESGGLGLSVVVNTIDGDTIASVTDSTVDANGFNGSDSFMVNTGELVSAPDVSSISAPSAYTPSMAEKQKNVSGLAIVATSDQAVAANAGTFGGGTAGAGAILPVTTIIGSNAKAFIQGGSVQAHLTGDPKATTFRVPTLDVRAGNHTYTGDFVVAIAGGGGDSIAAGVGTVKFNDHADAYIADATVGTTTQNIRLLGDVDVIANSTQAAATIVLGGAGSMNGGAASLAITLFSADTEAYVTGGTLGAAGLTVSATSDNAVNVLVGAAAIGDNGVGGSIAVTINNDTTLGYVGDMADTEADGTIDPTILTLTNADISATTSNDLKSLLIAGAGGFTAGVAAMANVTTLSSTTKAGFYGAQVNHATGDTKVGGIKVTANEYDGVDAKVGGAAVGITGAGVGIAANVVVLHSSVTGTILGSDINSGSTVDVEALSNKDIDALTVTGAVGFYAGVGAAVGVILVGTDASSDVAGQLNSGGTGTLADVDSLAPGNGIANSVNSGSADAVTASVAGGSMNAVSLTINSQGIVSTDNHSVGAAAGGAGVGGAVSYTDVGDTVIASLDSASPNAKSVSVTAAVLDGSGRAVDTEAEAGGAGGIGLGAGVAVSKLTNTVGARFAGSATGSNAGDFSLNASDTTSASSLTIGGAAGGAAVGAMISTASKDSTVSAYTQGVGNPLTNPTITNFNNVSVIASDAGAVDTSATGVAGGMAVAGNAAVATSDDNAHVYATLDDHTSITGASGLVTISATDTPDMSADAYGVAVSGGAALGAAVATADIDPTVKASIGSNSTISGAAGLTVNATLQQVTGQNSAETSAFSGSGGLYLALNGAVALTTNNSDVEAFTGDTVTLPNGDIGITATNTASLDAYASGIGVGGIAGGASDAESNTDSTTKATLGSHNKGTTHTGSLTVKAVGNDTNTSHADAGTYGIVAGNASVAKTSDTADVEALVDAHTALPASSITVLASHQDNYAELANSTEVSVLGASGAESRHNADVTVLTTIATGVSLIATGGIDISSEDDFNRVGTDDAADAGGGGVLNGAGATSKTNITGSSTVMIDDGVSLIAGDDLLTSPGHINLLADTHLTGNDVISLSTGGALEGAGVENDYDATVNNAVTMGATDTFLTFGNFNAGTYTISSVSIQALASTWGVLGAIADAEADLSIVTNQSVTLGAGSVVEVYGNANLTAGQNPADATATVMNGGAQAESYVRSLIAIPVAHAGTDLTNNTSLTIASGSIVNAGQNVTVGSYMGQVLPQADGTGHGFELGFIPATNGGEHALAHGTSTAQIDGTVTAGAYNDLEINIADCKDQGVYCDQIQVTGNMADASQISPLAGYLAGFLATNYINGNATGDEASFLAKGVSTVAVDAVLLNTLFASAGNVTVHADTVTGTGSLTANGGASITVNNDSPDYLVLGQVRIPDLAGGHVNFSENAVVASTVTATQNNPDGASNVSITDTFAQPVGNSQLGPAIFVGGSIENLGGLVEITNEHGSLGQFAPIVAQNVILNVPEGSLLIDLADGLLEPTGPNPIADWAPFMIFPGGNPKNGADADLAIAYAVNAVYNPNFQYTNAADFTAALTFTSDPSNPITPISHFGDGKNSAGATLLTYGVCLPDNSGPTRSCNIGDNTAASPLNGYLDLCVLPGFGCGGRGVSLVPVEHLTASSTTNITAANENTTASAINANTISIKATYIDINSNISAGPPTNWSVNLSSAAATEIANDQTAYQNGSVTNPNFILNNVGVIGAGDSLIKVTYVAGATAADGKIVVDNVLAAAQVAASIKIDGGIMSTNAMGRIHVNAGLGQVQINNQTAVPITVDNISAGNADRLGGLTGSIEIIDRLKTTGTDHYWYVYTPGQGTNVYQSSNPDATMDQASLVSSNGSTSFTYTPLPGMRWQWVETAFLKRNITLNALGADPTVGDWFFTDPNGNSLGTDPTNPWYYTDTFDPSSAVAGSHGTLFNYNGHVLSQDPAHAGSLLMNQSESLPYMQETISGTVQFAAITAVDGGCIYLSGVHCGMQAQGSYNSFVSQKSFNSALGVFYYPSEQSYWDMAYFGSGTVTMTTSVKADNPIAVDFSGGTRGSVIINSAAPVTIDGQITNPQGDTVITATGTNGNISTSTNGSVTTNNLTLDATGAVGAATNLFDTTIVGNGKLNATGDQGVYLAANGALNLAHVASSAGDVTLTAQGDITVAAGSTTPVITGNNVTLVAAREGSIGSSASPITMAATGTVNATADGDIVLEQTQGDLYAGSIKSLGIGSVLGDVTVTVDHGALKDAQNTTTAQALSDDQQQKIWKALKLTTALGGGVNSTSGSPTVAAVKQAVNVDYTQYWTLLSHGTVSGDAYTLNSNSISLFQTVAAAAGMTPQDYAAGLYKKVTTDFSQYVGTDWQTQSAFQTQVTNFDFTPSQAMLAGLTNDGDATWTEGELKSALSLTALQPSSNTTLGTTTPNISGGTVTLTASNGVGSLADPVSITIDKLTSGDLTSDQERAIALARNPGDIVFTGLDAQNNVVRFSGSTAPAGVTITGVEIQQAAPLFVAASNKFNASVQQGGVYAQATSGDLKIGSITATSGDINLAAPQNIVAADAGTTPVIHGGNITLLAGAGSIGAQNAPLIYVGTTLASASAGQDISLRSYGGDMIVGRVFAGGDVSLLSDGAILTSLEGVTVQADNLSLQAAGDIGSLAHPFAFQLAPGGTLTGSATGDVTLVSAASASIDNFTSGGDMNIASLGDLTTTSLLSTGTLTLNAGGTLLLGRIESDFNGDHAIDITAAAIAAKSGTTNNIVTTGANAKVYLAAETGIGASSQYIYVNTPWISPTTVSGGIYIHALSNITLPNIAVPGELQFIADRALTLGNVTATGALGLAATDNLIFGTITSGANLSLSGNTITGTSLTATGSTTVTAGHDLLLTGGVNAGAALSLSAGNDLTFAGLTSGGDTTLSADNTITGESFTSTGPATVTAGGDLSLDAVNAQNTLALSAGNDLTFAGLTSGGDTTLSAGHSLTGDNVNITGSLIATATQDLSLANVTTSADLSLSAGHDLTFVDLVSGGNAMLSAGNAITGHSLTATGSAIVTAGLGSFQIASITAANLTLTSLGDLNIPSITINGPVLISAPNITAHITNGSGDALAIDVTGINGAAAHTANLDINSPQGILFGNYFVDTGVISTNAAHVRFEHGNVANTMLLTTPFTNLFLNDTSPTPVRNVTEQLYAPGKTFFLDQDTTTTLTDAYFVAFGPGYTAQTLDKNGNIIPAISLVQVGPLPLSAPSWTRIFMQSEDGVGGLILTDPWFGSPTDFGNPDLWIVSIDGGLAVNLGTQP